MAKKRVRTYIWYLYTTDGHTNEVFARNLPEEDALESVLCNDGEKRPMWRCKHKDVALFRENAARFNLKFKVFVQEGGGLPREHKGWSRKVAKVKKSLRT